MAGPIQGYSYGEVTDWRVEAESFLRDAGIDALSPMRYKEYLKQYEEMGQHYEIHPLSTARAIITRDRNDVLLRADGMLVNFLGAKHISRGTMVEYGWADAKRIPVVTVMEKEGNPHDYVFVREISGAVVDTLEEGLFIISHWVR